MWSDTDTEYIVGPWDRGLVEWKWDRSIEHCTCSQAAAVQQLAALQPHSQLSLCSTPFHAIRMRRSAKGHHCRLPHTNPSTGAPTQPCSLTALLSVLSPADSGGVVLDEKDPERLLKLKECCDLLLAGGYFRARIPTLSPFDKVVGGLAWSITASGVEVDVDVIFQENASIGQKMSGSGTETTSALPIPAASHLCPPVCVCCWSSKTSDQVVKALVAMKCPFPLQSHQIQGLDYTHLFPIIQWLVRKVIETRRLTGDTTRLQSLHQFSQHYRLPSDERDRAGEDWTLSVVDEYRPQRKFRKKADARFDSVERRTEATLLEYGERIVSTATVDEEAEEKQRRTNDAKGGKSALLAKFDPSKSSAALEAKKAETEATQRAALEAEAARYAAMQQQLDEHSEQSKLSGANVGSLVGRQADEIRRAQAEYEEKKRRQEEVEAGVGSRKSGEQLFSRQMEALRKKVAAAEDALTKKQQEQQAAQAKHDSLQADVNKKAAYIERIHRETNKLSAMEQSTDNASILGKLQQLVQQNEQLKQQEADFRAACIAEREQILIRIKSLTDPSSSSVDQQRLQEIESLYNSESSRLQRARAQLASLNQSIGRIERSMEDVPTRAELLQYEKRFVELYHVVSLNLAETKKYYALYNSLRDAYQFMGNEKSLLESIIAQYPAASRQKAGKEHFVVNMEGIIHGVDRQRAAKQTELDRERAATEALTAQYNALTDKQRSYFKAVKEFQQECVRNEKLTQLSEQQDAGTVSDAGNGETQTDGHDS